MHQGASVVRFANAHLNAYKKKTFVFMAIFIAATGEADRYLLYQKKDSRKVCTHVPYITKSFAEMP
jgi:predicted aconitase